MGYKKTQQIGTSNSTAPQVLPAPPVVIALDAVEKKYAEKKASLNTLLSDISSTDEKKQNALKAYEAARVQLSDTYDELETAKQELTTAKEGAVSALAQANELMQNAFTEIQNKRNELLDEQVTNAENKTAYKLEMARLVGDFEAKETLFKSLSERHDELQRKFNNLEIEMGVKEKALTEIVALIKEKNDKVLLIQSEIDSLILTKNSLVESINLLNETKSLRETEIKNSDKTIEDKKLEIKKLDKEKFAILEYKNQLAKKEKFIRAKFAQANVAFE